MSYENGFPSPPEVPELPEAIPADQVADDATLSARPIRRLSASRVALQGPLLLLAIAGIAFGGALTWESRDQWQEVILGTKPSLANGSAGSCHSGAMGPAGACSGQAGYAMNGSCCRSGKGAAMAAGGTCNSSANTACEASEAANSDEPAGDEVVANTPDSPDVNSTDVEMAETNATAAEGSAEVSTDGVNPTATNSAEVATENAAADEIPLGTKPAFDE